VLTLTSQYALQALIHMVQQGHSEPLSAKQIAEQTSIPGKYLSMILSSLVHEGVLESARGKGGGFMLADSPREISLWQIVLPFEPSFRARRKCPFGNKECSDSDPCLAHFEWKRILEHEQAFLEQTSLYDISVKEKDTGGRRAPKKKGSTNEPPVPA
jgi:Rrf2 family protein